ncbi:hypothetical protein [Dyella lutea]|uniref:Tail assembly chaperone E/41/14-like protein n=1 Tax=Dyella lutea TaxID=2950441 RepID=A0ABT1FGZ2_9GAMM|nr:hypothetical protein [Dyella lutea]MCP1375393.1 hypothetical protein [Dyella lutea]
MAKITGTLKHGLKVGDQVYKDYELRDSNTDDMFDAEDDAPAHRRLSYNGALLARQIVKLGELSGPFDLKWLRKLHKDDVRQLFDEQDKVEALGKSEPGG